MAQKTITIILILVVIGGLAWFVNKNYLNQATPESSGTGGLGVRQNLGTDQLVYVVSGSVRAIWTRDQSGNLRKVFTDADEREKMLMISNVSQNTGDVLAITNQDTKAKTGKLIGIHLANGSKTVLQTSFGVPRSWSISPDGEKFAYVLFSNVEENYGYTLYTESKTGERRTKLFNSSEEIKSPVWSPDGTKIALATTEGTTGQIKTINVGSKDAATLQGFENQVVDGVDWLSPEEIVFSLRDINGDKGKIETVSLLDKNVSSITDFNGGQVSFLAASADGKFLGYLVAQYGENFQDTTSGQIFIENLADKTQKAITKGNLILGWLK